MTPRPPTSTLFPYTTLFRSRAARRARGNGHPDADSRRAGVRRSEEHTSELQSHHDVVCRLLLEKKKGKIRAQQALEDASSRLGTFSGGGKAADLRCGPVLYV